MILISGAAGGCVLPPSRHTQAATVGRRIQITTESSLAAIRHQIEIVDDPKLGASGTARISTGDVNRVHVAQLYRCALRASPPDSVFPWVCDVSDKSNDVDWAMYVARLDRAGIMTPPIRPQSENMFYMCADGEPLSIVVSDLISSVVLASDETGCGDPSEAREKYEAAVDSVITGILHGLQR